ncbi:MAG TPA: YetF domain-containing protein [Gemmatimonadaceae bacterium]|nr:YetF domain-containing protein [Gemmatimonadaceae bacterium]
MHTLLTELLTPGEPLIAKVIRTVVVYVFLLIGLRLAGKRELGQLNPFDLVVLLVLSNTLQNAIIGNDNSITGGLIGAALLLVINYAVVRYLFLHPKIDTMAEGDAVILVQSGEVVEGALKRELITRAELASAARRQGIDNLSEIECARLEVGGALTFVLKHPSSDEYWRKETSERLRRIEEMLTHRA